MADKVTLVKIIQIMVIDNCMSDDSAFWAAYLKLPDETQREVLRECFPTYQHDLLDMQAGLLSLEQAEVLAAGDADQQVAVVRSADCHHLEHFLWDVFEWRTPDPKILAKYGGEL